MADVNFDKYTQEAYEYFNDLALQLNHPDEQERAFRLWKAVMFSIRDRISISESLDLMSQMPMMLKALYAEQWKFHEKPPLNYDSIDEMQEEVKNRQDQFGESDFSWETSTEDLISITIDSMKEYWTGGQVEQLRGQLPKEVKELVH